VSDAVFTAFGAVTGAGDEVAFRESWLEGRSSVRAFDDKAHDGLPPGYGAPLAFVHKDLRGLPGGRGLRPGTLTAHSFNAVGAVGRALANANIDPESDDVETADRRGVYLGTYTNFPAMAKHLKLAWLMADGDSAAAGEYAIDDGAIPTGMKGFTGFDFLKLMNNMPTAHAAIQAGARGPANTFLGHASVGLQAIGRAWDALRLDLADQVVCGGSGPGTIEGLCLVHRGRGWLASPGLEPGAAARPLDADATGMVPGDGGAAFVLETADNAAARGATPLATLVGYDDRLVVPTAERGPLPDAAGVVAPLRAVLEQAGWQPADVDLVSATGSGLPELDEVEAAALAEVFGADHLAGSLVLHTGVVGFTEAAHGPIGLVGALQSMADGQLPPTVGLSSPRGALAGLTPRAAATGRDVARAVVLSVAPEGTVSALAVERA